MINWELFRPWNLSVIVLVVLLTMFILSAAKQRLDARTMGG